MTNKIKEIQKQLNNTDIINCYQCGNCTAGCPLTFEMDIMPHQIMRFIQLGDIEKALKSKTIWVCTSCFTCSTRCPQKVDITGIMNKLRILSAEKNIEPGSPEVLIFNRAFLNNIRQFGRLFEPTMIAEFNLKSGHLFQNFSIAPSMLFKGKLPLMPNLKSSDDLKNIFDKTQNK